MADDILFEDGDGITAETLGEALGREGISNYVERGLGVTADYSAAVADIDSGKAYLLHNGRDLTVRPDARAGVPLATDGTNYIYLAITESTNADGSAALGVEYAVQQSETSPGGTALLIAEVDMGAQTTTPRNDTAPIYRRDAETYKGNDIVSDGDGVVDDADHAATADTAASVDGADVSGQVASAKVAGAIVSADYGDLAAGDLVHTAGALGDTTVTVGSNPDGSLGSILMQDAANNDDTFFWRDADRGKLLLGGNSAQVTLKTDLNAQRFSLENVAGVTASAISVRKFGNGLIAFRGRSQSSKDTPGIAPINSGTAEYGNAIQFELDSSTWSVLAHLDVLGYLATGNRVEVGETDGLTITPGKNPAIKPRLNGTAKDFRAMRYDSSVDRWVFAPSVEFENNIRVTGNWLQVPSVTADQNNAPVGSLWYRSDLD